MKYEMDNKVDFPYLRSSDPEYCTVPLDHTRSQIRGIKTTPKGDSLAKCNVNVITQPVGPSWFKNKFPVMHGSHWLNTAHKKFVTSKLQYLLNLKDLRPQTVPGRWRTK